MEQEVPREHKRQYTDLDMLEAFKHGLNFQPADFYGDIATKDLPENQAPFWRWLKVKDFFNTLPAPDLDYYMNLPYTIEIVHIPDAQGGGFSARLPELGRLAMTGDGETIQEALSKLEEIKRERFMTYLEKGVSIPEPEVS